MKPFVLLLLLCVVAVVEAQNKVEIPLKGDYKVVSAFADYKVKVVESFADVEIEKTIEKPWKNNQWREVRSHEDFTIMFVESFPDFTIKWKRDFSGDCAPSAASNDEKILVGGGNLIVSNRQKGIKFTPDTAFFEIERKKGVWFPTVAKVKILTDEQEEADIVVARYIVDYPTADMVISIKKGKQPKKPFYWQEVGSNADFTIRFTGEPDIRALYYGNPQVLNHKEDFVLQKP